jgi:hypothetical protein
MLKFLVWEREKAGSCGCARRLEERVRERTEQLKTEMSAPIRRGEFRAVLSERRASPANCTTRSSRRSPAFAAARYRWRLSRNPADAGPPLSRRAVSSARAVSTSSLHLGPRRANSSSLPRRGVSIASGQILTGSGISGEFTTTGAGAA